MNAKNPMARLIFAVASLASTTLMLGSVFALADHYGDQAQVASIRPAVVAQR